MKPQFYTTGVGRDGRIMFTLNASGESLPSVTQSCRPGGGGPKVRKIPDSRRLSNRRNAACGGRR
ncbi:MAG: hypothetical protein WCG94_05360 [Methanothrix sp.]